MSELEQVLLQALRSCPGWLSRREIADAIGRPNGKLLAYDRKLLQRLAEQGLVEVQLSRRGVVQQEYIYRAK
jgi:DNA-binding IclR family transcriptional regulator